MATATRIPMPLLRLFSVIGLLLVSAVATTESVVTREPGDVPELALLRELHDTLLQLQLTELALKNRRDAELEHNISTAVEHAQATRSFALHHRDELPQLFNEAAHEAFALLHESFGDRRYTIYSRFEGARRLILRLELSATAHGMPEEGAALYNQILDSFYAFGISVVPGETPALQGILFGSTPDEARIRYQRLRYTSNQ